jgi:hypothetical protein
MASARHQIDWEPACLTDCTRASTPLIPGCGWSAAALAGERESLERQGTRGEDVSTGDLRAALTALRSLFDRLLEASVARARADPNYIRTSRCPQACKRPPA